MIPPPPTALQSRIEQEPNPVSQFLGLDDVRVRVEMDAQTIVILAMTIVVSMYIALFLAKATNIR
jgi:hypothetical protein